MNECCLACTGSVTTLSWYVRRPGRGYGLTCPGAAWPADRPGRVLAAAEVSGLAGYLADHPEVSVAEFAGNPLCLTASALRGYAGPLLAAGNLAAIQLPTRALACWPYRFLYGPGRR